MSLCLFAACFVDCEQAPFMNSHHDQPADEPFWKRFLGWNSTYEVSNYIFLVKLILSWFGETVFRALLGKLPPAQLCFMACS
jgi:hypothetical protein